jgi:hypothetical protein
MNKNLPSVCVGDKFRTNKCGDLTIISYNGSIDVDVRFDDTGYITNTTVAFIKSGAVRDKLCSNIYGVGYFGVGIYNRKDYVECYDAWFRMMERAYSVNYSNKHPSYISVTVCDDWHDYQNFAKWFYSQYFEKSYQLDKDIIVRNNHCYCPEMCSLIPQKINKLIVNRQYDRGNCPIGVFVKNGRYTASCNGIDSKNKHLGSFDDEISAFNSYRAYKLSVITQVANEYKNVLDERIYNALISWKINIDD